MKTEVKEEEATPSHNISASGYNAPPSNYSSSVSGYNASASSYNAPSSGYNTSDSYQSWQQQQQQPQQGHKRTFEESRGRGYYEYREDKRYVQRRIRGTYLVHLACFLSFPKLLQKGTEPRGVLEGRICFGSTWDFGKGILFSSSIWQWCLILLSCKDCKRDQMKDWAGRVAAAYLILSLKL